MAKKAKPNTILEKATKDLLKYLEVEAKVEVTQDKEGLVTVQLDTEEPGVLIGYHGQVLDSIQRLLSMMIYRQTDEWVRILVEINDYRQRRKETLERMALSLAQKVKFSGESQDLPPMSSFERRIIHLALVDDPEVETVSEGEGQERRVVVGLRSRDEGEK